VKGPVAESESEDSGLVRNYGMLVVPLARVYQPRSKNVPQSRNWRGRERVWRV
jgi:hypothetical protein